MLNKEEIELFYRDIHYWLAENYGKAVHCENPNCKHISNNFEWSMIHELGYDYKRKNFQQLCKSCHMLYDLAENEERNKKISTYHKGRKKSENHKQKMKDNHMGFIGKHHNEEFKQKQKENNTGEKNPMYGQGEKLKGENNGMYKKTIYDVWLEKYGKEEANIRYVNWKNSISNGIKRKKKVEVV